MLVTYYADSLYANVHMQELCAELCGFADSVFWELGERRAWEPLLHFVNLDS
jgi:hypothetical protein